MITRRQIGKKTKKTIGISHGGGSSLAKKGDHPMISFLVLFALSVNSHALLPINPEKTGIGREYANTFSFDFSGSNDYRLGDEWGKKPVTLESLKSESETFKRAALATARTGGATGFFLGKYEGEYVMATNHHVYEYAYACLGNKIRFPLLGIEGTCDRFLGSFSDVDLAIFTIKLKNPQQDGPKLEAVAKNFSFREDVTAGQKLLTIGFGVADNPMRSLVANQDSDCYVFSKKGEYRFMADPDRYNPGSYRAWSFALGCDVSHGDSGSAIVDRETGKVVGIIWTGNIPKTELVQTSRSLTEMFNTQSESIWQELSYAVPAVKIGEFLSRRSEDSSVSDQDRKLLKALLAN